MMDLFARAASGGTGTSIEPGLPRLTHVDQTDTLLLAFRVQGRCPARTVKVLVWSTEQDRRHSWR